MISLRFEELAKTTGGRLLTVDRAGQTFVGVSVDSRTLDAGQLFFALRGEATDGHRFIGQAVSKGASGVVAEPQYFDSRPLPDNAAVIGVPDTHAAMLRLAEAYLSGIDAERVGITGSNGKTTAKEFTHRLLSAVQADVYCSPGNYNNLYGIPLALFEMPVETRIAVLEMGVSVPGEMTRLASLVRPHLMVVTNVGPTHLEYLGSVENVAREKLQAMQYARPDAPLIVNADDPILVAETKRVCPRPVTFAVKNKATFRPESVEPAANGKTVVSIDGARFVLSSFGAFQVYNLLAAYAVTRTLGFSLAEVDTERISLSTLPMRGEIVKRGGITFVSDCYNANPESVRAGLESFADYPSRGRRIIVLGDMLELGREATHYHSRIGKTVSRQPLDLLLAVGPLSAHIVEGAGAAGVPDKRLRHFADARSCAKQITRMLQPGDLVYLKGSRGIGLEVILEQFAGAEEGG